MALIDKPKPHHDVIKSVSHFLQLVSAWQRSHNIDEKGFHSCVWYRGHPQNSFLLRPGVYRDDFTKQTGLVHGKGKESKRLNLERSMLNEFKTSGAEFFDAEHQVELYFIAQHYGMPTRLLDWTTNPLAGLFFAAEKDHGHDGAVIIMYSVNLVLPTPPNLPNGDPIPSGYPRWVLPMRHPYIANAIKMSFWIDTPTQLPPMIVPVRPDNRAGRITQQSSCFTLHPHEAEDVSVKTLEVFTLPKGVKEGILRELLGMNINQFTIYNDLDHLSKEIKRTWKFKGL